MKRHSQYLDTYVVFLCKHPEKVKSCRAAGDASLLPNELLVRELTLAVSVEVLASSAEALDRKHDAALGRALRKAQERSTGSGMRLRWGPLLKHENVLLMHLLVILMHTPVLQYRGVYDTIKIARRCTKLGDSRWLRCAPRLAAF